MPSPDTVAVRSPVLEGDNENMSASIVRSTLASPIGKVTSYSRTLSQDSSWTMVTFTRQFVRRLALARQGERQVLHPRADFFMLGLDGDGRAGDGASRTVLRRGAQAHLDHAAVRQRGFDHIWG